MFKIDYHPKLLRIFTKEELDKLKEASIYSVNKEGLINVMVIITDEISAEIFTDCEAKELDFALINLLEDYGKNLPRRLSKEMFWSIFINSKKIQVQKIQLDL